MAIIRVLELLQRAKSLETHIWNLFQNKFSLSQRHTDLHALVKEIHEVIEEEHELAEFFGKLGDGGKKLHSDFLLLQEQLAKQQRELIEIDDMDDNHLAHVLDGDKQGHHVSETSRILQSLITEMDKTFRTELQSLVMTQDLLHIYELIQRTELLEDKPMIFLQAARHYLYYGDFSKTRAEKIQEHFQNVFRIYGLLYEKHKMIGEFFYGIAFASVLHHRDHIAFLKVGTSLFAQRNKEIPVPRNMDQILRESFYNLVCETSSRVCFRQDGETVKNMVKVLRSYRPVIRDIMDCIIKQRDDASETVKAIAKDVQNYADACMGKVAREARERADEAQALAQKQKS